MSGQKDNIVGTYAANRELAELERVIGVLINNLAIRTQVNPGEPFFSLLKNINQEVLESTDNKDYPFEKIVDELNLLRDPSRPPLFNVVFQMFNKDIENISSIFPDFSHPR